MTALAMSSAAAQDFTIVPGERVGFVSVGMDEGELKKYLPKAEISRDFFEESWSTATDGPLRCVTKLYADSGRELWVVWKSDLVRKWKPSQLSQCKTAAPGRDPAYALIALSQSMTVEAMDPSPWKTESGIGVGATLDALEAANGQPVTFSLQVQTEGNVLDWNDGALEGTFSDALLTYTAEDTGARIEEYATERHEVDSGSLPAELKKQIRLAMVTVKLAR